MSTLSARGGRSINYHEHSTGTAGCAAVTPSAGMLSKDVQLHYQSNGTLHRWPALFLLVCFYLLHGKEAGSTACDITGPGSRSMRGSFSQ